MDAEEDGMAGLAHERKTVEEITNELGRNQCKQKATPASVVRSIIVNRTLSKFFP